MRTCNHIFTTIANFASFLEANLIDPTASMLVRIHSVIHDADAMKLLLPEIRALLPNAEIIGCSSEAVICDGKSLQDVCMISITLTDACYVKSTHIECFSDGIAVPGETLAMQVIEKLQLTDKKGQLIVFMPQRYYRASRFADTIDRMCPNILLIGGIANDALVQIAAEGKILDADFTIADDFCGHGELAAAVIAHPDVHCFESYALGMERINTPKPVNRYSGNVIYEIGGKTPEQWLSELGGDRITKENLGVIHIFPIVRTSRGNCAWPMAFFGGDSNLDAIMILDDIEEGESVCLGYISPNLVVDEVVRMYRKIKAHPAETMFVYSCTQRSTILQNCSAWELEPLTNTTASGAFLGGEFFYDGEHNRFGNCNFVVASMATSESYMKLNTYGLSMTNHLYHDNEHLIEYLTLCASSSTGTLSNFNQEMKSRLYASQEMKIGRLSKLNYDMQVHEINKLCMISLRNTCELIAYAGYSAYEKLLWSILEMMKEFLRDHKIWYYISEQGELLVSANDSISAQAFEILMQKLQEHLTMVEYYRLTPVYEFCLVLNETNLLRYAKVVQSELHSRNDRDFLVYSSDMGMEENNVHDVHMVQVIRDAIVHNRVQPYYQGIHDNSAKEIAMFEALMRLTDANDTVYNPNDFLPVAKKYGLYRQLSRQMVGKVMKEFEDRDVQVTINLTMQDILDSKMTELIYTNMKYSCHPQNYVFEVVETEDINDYDAIVEFAERIHDYGGQIALDDFGSGFSNLIHVIRMDMDYLKVDGGIISKICEDADCCNLLEIVSMWCKTRGKKVIAEYVENAEIQKVLCKYDVDYSQGFLFSKPQNKISYETDR
ncbi:MAG: EAL domain-containing protein [Ruminococcus sp.]|nr:EAL domain-containing protein [Ruminococcus sp.]